MGYFERMYTVVDAQIGGITHTKTWKESEYKFSHKGTIEYKEENGEQQGDDGGHGQPFFVLGIFVMYPMYFITKFFPGVAMGL